MILLAVVLAVSGVLYAVRAELPGTAGLRCFWARRGPAITAWVKGAPLTYRYLLVLVATTWMLGGTSPRVRRAFLEQQATNLDQLSHQPVEVLIRSALYVSPIDLALWAVGFTLVMAPLEHRIGWRRVLAIFLIGHVGATLIVAAVLRYLLAAGEVPQSVTHSIDVGASYGFAAVAGSTCHLWTGWRRAWWAAACLAVGALLLWAQPTSSNLGHALALLLGLACRPIVTSAPPRRAASAPPSP